MTSHDSRPSWRTRFEQTFETLFFATVSILVPGSVLAVCIDPTLIVR